MPEKPGNHLAFAASCWNIVVTINPKLSTARSSLLVSSLHHPCWRQGFIASCTRFLSAANASASRSISYACFSCLVRLKIMLNGLLILIMTGHNTVHLAILFWKLEAKKLHDWVACIWPPSTIKDTGSRLHSKLKEAIAQISINVKTGLEKNVFGNHFVTMPKADTRTPPAFASDPLKRVSISGDRESNGANIINSAIDANVQSGGMYSSATVGSGTPSHVEPEIVEIDGPSPITTQFPEQESNFIRSPSPHGPSAMTRKGANYVERQNSEISYYADDEDANRKKYTKRGTFRHKFLRMLLPFWSSALPTLPVTAPPRKESDAPEGRSRHQKSSRMDPTKILLALAIIEASVAFDMMMAFERDATIASVPFSVECCAFCVYYKG
uniref:ZFPL1-like U-box domain-containing protein n=1 Tax=Oryza sativa subsp. japonica TaxID=39947 RepID=Q94HD7_ORYSJ|nr:Hypothetical protein [Oryza sativa Japonica Group]